jgi:hypothetical protein
VYFLVLITFLLVAPAVQTSPVPAITGPLIGNDIRTNSAVNLRLSEKPFIGTVIVFLSAECPCSLSHLDSLKWASNQFPQFRFLGVHSNRDEPTDLVLRKFTEERVPFPVIEDTPTLSLANDLGALKTPHIFVLDRSGQILYRGAVDANHLVTNEEQRKNNYLVSALSAIVAGHKPEPKETTPLGCYIAR